MKSRIKVNLFGCVRLSNGTTMIDESAIRSKRLLALLTYFIINRRESVLNKVLCEQFIGNEYKDPKGALKNLMCRLRHMLKILGTEEYVCTLSGGYRWNPDIAIETDYEKFECLYNQISTEEDRQEKKRLCIEAAEYYKGNFSSGIADERWIVPRLVQYQTQYIEIVKELTVIYEEEGAWRELEQLCRSALTSELFEEEIHGKLIKSLQRQKKTNQAIAHYEDTKKLFYSNFGVWNPEKLRNSFQKPSKEQGAQPLTLADLEESCGQQPLEGAFFCDYQTFQQIYRLDVRRASRLGISNCLLLLTVRRRCRLWDNAVVDIGMAYGLDALEKILRETLRIEDLMARSSPTQFVALLSSCSYEAGMAIAERIQESFRKKTGKQKLELSYELGELPAPCAGKEAIGF